MSEVMVGKITEIDEEDYRILDLGEVEIGIFRRGDKVVAYENRCPHYGGPVCQGKIFPRVEEELLPDKTSKGLRFTADKHVVCPWHGYEFNLDTGRHPGDPRIRLRAFNVSVRDNNIYVNLPD
jgi:nitrite reductase/ring-hydroxylating ferredoxin subunit